MATEDVGKTISLTAAADLSSSQFFLIKVDSNGKAALGTAVTDRCVGVLQNTPTAGQPAAVMVGPGITKLKSGSALSIGDIIASDSAGKGTALTLDAGGTVYNYAVGEVVTASAAANGLAEVLLYGGPQSFLV